MVCFQMKSGYLLTLTWWIHIFFKVIATSFTGVASDWSGIFLLLGSQPPSREWAATAAPSRKRRRLEDSWRHSADRSLLSVKFTAFHGIFDGIISWYLMVSDWIWGWECRPFFFGWLEKMLGNGWNFYQDLRMIRLNPGSKCLAPLL